MIGTFLIKLVLSIINPSEVLKINSHLMVLDLIAFFIYMELIEFLLRNGKGKWFLKKSVK